MDCADPQHDTGTAAFYDTNAGPVYSYCLSLCADPEVAANAFHRAMLRAWQSGGTRARAFALARAECRMRGLRVPVPQTDDERDARELARVFTRLPPRDAEAAELTLRYGLGTAELAEAFGLPVAHAERLAADARDLFVDALTAESHVGVSEGAVLGELVRSPHPLARVAALLPCQEPDAGLRGRVMAGLSRRAGARRTARLHVPGVVWARSAVRAGGARRARPGRTVARSAAIACSVMMVVGFVTALSRPSAVGTVPKPSSGAVVAPPRSPSPPARVAPRRTHSVQPPGRRASPPNGGRRQRPVAARTPDATPTHHTRRHLSGRDHHASPDPGDELARLYERWREQRRERYDHDRDGDHRRVYTRDEAPHHHRYPYYYDAPYDR